MTEQEYLKAKAAINAKYVTNPDAPEKKKELTSLRQKNYRHRRKAKITRKKDTSNGPVRISFDESELLKFTDEVEQGIIRIRLNDIRKQPKEIAETYGQGISSQQVTSILQKDTVREFIQTIMKRDISLVLETMVLQGIQKNDIRWANFAHENGYVTLGKKDSCDGRHAEPLTNEVHTKYLTSLAEWIAAHEGKEDDYTLVFKAKTPEAKVVEI